MAKRTTNSPASALPAAGSLQNREWLEDVFFTKSKPKETVFSSSERPNAPKAKNLPIVSASASASRRLFAQ